MLGSSSGGVGSAANTGRLMEKLGIVVQLLSNPDELQQRIEDFRARHNATSNPMPSAVCKIIRLLPRDAHRHSQDFLWGGALFYTEKVDDPLFSSSPSKHRLKLLNYTPHRPDFPNFLKKLDSCLGCTLCLGVHLQLSPVNVAPKIFLLVLGVHVHPVHPVATPMVTSLQNAELVKHNRKGDYPSNYILSVCLSVCLFVTPVHLSRQFNCRIRTKSEFKVTASPKLSVNRQVGLVFFVNYVIVWCMLTLASKRVQFLRDTSTYTVSQNMCQFVFGRRRFLRFYTIGNENDYFTIQH